MTAGTKTSSGRKAPPYRLGLWAVFLALWAIAGGLHVGWRRAEAGWQAGGAARLAAFNASCAQVAGLAAGPREGRPRRGELEQRINGGRKFEMRERNGVAYAWWRDPVSTCPFTLRFDAQERLAGVGAAFEPVRTVPAWLDLFGEDTRQWLGGGDRWRGALPWLVLALPVVLGRRGRVLSGDLWLAAALVIGGAWALSPRWEMRAAALALVGVTVGARVAWQLVRPAPDYPACARCGYNLTGNVTGVCPECGRPVGEAGRRGADGCPTQG